MKAIPRVWCIILLLVVSYLLLLVSVPFLMRGKTEDGLKQKPPQSPIEMVIVDTLRAGDTLDGLFHRRGFTSVELLEITRASREYYNLNRVDAGTEFSLALDEDGSIRIFTCVLDDMKELIVERSEGGYAASVQEMPCDIRTRTVSGVVVSSLYETLLDLGENPGLTMALSDIFAWQVDFNTDVRKGDRFYVLIEERVCERKSPVFFKLIAARMINQSRVLTAIRFKDPDGHLDYYDLDGKSLKRKFLRSPLRYTRVSSRFSNRRYHPILKIYRPHYGVDYAAPTGTPVVSAGDGVVVYVGWNGGFGRFIRIRHNSIYETTYGHLSRYARGIRKGAKVKQGEVIGYVGASGLATGPHLDYRLKKNGLFVNPLKIDLPSANPVNENYMDQFKSLALSLSERLEKYEMEVEFTRKGGEGPNNGG